MLACTILLQQNLSLLFKLTLFIAFVEEIRESFSHFPSEYISFGEFLRHYLGATKN